MDTSNTQPYHIPDDAVWFITGCSSGIGLALAHLIAAKKPGFRLVATARNPASLDCLPSTPNVLKLALDVTSQASVDAAIAKSLETFGQLDVVVNNAGYALQGDTENATEEQARREMETLFWGTARTTKHAMRIMREHRGGLVMNVTSVGGFAGIPGSAFYHAGKFAVEGFTESVAKEVRPEWNTHFCIIEPGGVKTEFVGNMDRIAPHAAYAQPDSPSRMLEAYVNIPQNRETWSRPEDMAAVILQVATRGERIPIRLPLGGDAWTFIRAEVDKMAKEMDELRGLSFAAGDTMHLEDLGFLNKKAS